jgi:hypothetical protein
MKSKADVMTEIRIGENSECFIAHKWMKFGTEFYTIFFVWGSNIHHVNCNSQMNESLRVLHDKNLKQILITSEKRPVEMMWTREFVIYFDMYFLAGSNFYTIIIIHIY